MIDRKTAPTEKDCREDPYIASAISMKEGMSPKNWNTFWKTGLPGMLNTILGVFGWAIVADCDENGDIISVYPARTLFRGCDEAAQDRWYARVGEYLKMNSHTLYHEAFEMHDVQTENDTLGRLEYSHMESSEEESEDEITTNVSDSTLESSHINSETARILAAQLSEIQFADIKPGDPIPIPTNVP